MVKVDDKIYKKADVVEILRQRDGWICRICNIPFDAKSIVTVDHIHPLSKGGTWTMTNLQLAHKPCNAKKSDRTYDENGVLQPVIKEQKVSRAVKRSQRPPVCSKCNNGRLLGKEDICDVCGSMPQPYSYPHWAKLKPSECPHEGPWWCWMEALVPGLRRAAIVDVLDGQYLDE